MAMWQFRDVTIDIDNLGGDVNNVMPESLKCYHEAHGQNRTRGDPHQVDNEGMLFTSAALVMTPRHGGQIIRMPC